MENGNVVLVPYKNLQAPDSTVLITPLALCSYLNIIQEFDRNLTHLSIYLDNGYETLWQNYSIFFFIKLSILHMHHCIKHDVLILGNILTGTRLYVIYIILSKVTIKSKNDLLCENTLKVFLWFLNITNRFIRRIRKNKVLRLSKVLFLNSQKKLLVILFFLKKKKICQDIYRDMAFHSLFFFY